MKCHKIENLIGIDPRQIIKDEHFKIHFQQQNKSETDSHPIVFDGFQGGN